MEKLKKCGKFICSGQWNYNFLGILMSKSSKPWCVLWWMFLATAVEPNFWGWMIWPCWKRVCCCQTLIASQYSRTYQPLYIQPLSFHSAVIISDCNIYGQYWGKTVPSIGCGVPCTKCTGCIPRDQPQCSTSQFQTWCNLLASSTWRKTSLTLGH